MTITLFENHRAVFYTPFYAVHALGAYREEGLDIELGISPSPAATAKALLNGDTDVVWGGPLRLLKTYDENPACGLVGFCEAVTRDPFFLVGRAPRAGFEMGDLMGLRLGSVSEVPTPWLCLQDDIRRAGLDPDALDRVADRSMAENAAALRQGTLDVMQAYQPFVEMLVRDGAGHVWYAQADRGPTTYTTLYTIRRMLEQEPDVLRAMTRAMYRTQKWLHEAGADAVAGTVAPFFPDLDLDILTGCVARYLARGVWGRNPILPKDGFERLKAACLSSGYIRRGCAFEDCIDTALAYDVVNEDPPAIG